MKLNEYLIEKEFQKKNAPSDMICYPIVRGNCLPILACANKKKSGSNGRLLYKHANQFLEEPSIILISSLFYLQY